MVNLSHMLRLISRIWVIRHNFLDVKFITLVLLLVNAAKLWWHFFESLTRAFHNADSAHICFKVTPPLLLTPVTLRVTIAVLQMTTLCEDLLQ